MAPLLQIDAAPSPWPLLGPCEPSTASLVVIDMQRDFVDRQGWFASLGMDVSACRSVVPVIGSLLAAARSVRELTVVHTRQGNAPDLSDLPPTKQAQGLRTNAPIGARGPLGRGLIRGEPGWEIVPELAPVASERIVEKPGFSAFVGTDLDPWLRARGVGALILCGVTANVCVLSALYTAVDLGYDCLVVEDAVAGATPEARQVLLDLVRYQDGLFGSVAPASAVVEGLERVASRTAPA